MIELIDVSVSFGTHLVLNEVNLKISKGESFVIMGPSGQGKSVLLKVMAGIIPPSKGKVLIEGKDFSQLEGKEREEIIYKMGMLFQKNALFDSLSVFENIAFPLRETSHLTEEEISGRVNHFLSEVNIADSKSLFPDEISGGMQKRLGIARALALKPEILFYDDPTAGLDPITSRLIIDLILKLKKETNSTIVAITNELTRAYQMADRIGLIFDKELLITGTISETKKHPHPAVQQFIKGLLTGPLTVQDDYF